MYKSNENIACTLNKYKIQGHMFRYSSFVPRLYNLCMSLGFEPGHIMPSRAFCSDESQGYPIILIAKHFQTFPFNHGMVGGVVATDRHGPHAAHGKDAVIIQASHVGYDAQTGGFGQYKRLCTENQGMSASCGKVDHVLGWYQTEYNFAKENIFIEHREGKFYIIIDNQLLNESRDEGLFLTLDELLIKKNGHYIMNDTFSTSQSYLLNPNLNEVFKDFTGIKEIGDKLLPDYFYFKKETSDDIEGQGHLECNLLQTMPWILSSKYPLLEAAKINSQVEFDRAYRTVIKSECYNNKKVVYISGLNIDISPDEGQLFPLTKFVPWAAFIKDKDNKHKIVEQDELVSMLNQQSSDNPDQIDLETAIQAMQDMQEVII